MEVTDLGAAWAHDYSDGLDAGEPASTRISVAWLLARAVGFCRRAIVWAMTAVAGLVGILPPNALSAEPIASQLHPVAKLAWLANTETNLSGYRLYYGFAPDRLNYSTNVGLGTNATIELPVGNETYFFAATAINTDSLESQFSNTVSNWFSVGPDVVVTQVVMDRLHGTEGRTLLLPFPSNLVNAVEWTLVEPPEGGTLNVRSNHLEFVPNTGFAGTNHFRYAVNLGNRELVHLKGGMEFQPVNDPPVALDDEVVTPVN
ncbi:MAG: hypothetical protein JNK85_22750, partial [Verrucomicrobiales bacterium]|nr:hypothetical protein [Verrucomicrobiales bacterium]